MRARFNRHRQAPRRTTKTPFPATGYFSIGHKDGRSFFVTPTGEPFYSTGIDHVSSDPDTDQTTGQCPYCETIQSEYPSTAAWATATVSQLRSWGFNSLGAFSDDSTFATQMPYSVQLGMASGDDWFAPSFVTNADEVAATQVAPLANDPESHRLVHRQRARLGTERKRSGNAAPALSGASRPARLGWPSPSSTWEIPTGSSMPWPLGTSKSPPRPFACTTRHHLILGVKAEGQEIQPQLLEAASPYVDVFSIDDYQLMPGFAQIIDKIWPQYLPVTATFNNFEKYVKRPIMVAEYSFIATTPQTPDTVPGVYAVYPDQTARAAAYTDYIAPLYEHSPWVVGDEWFEYVDEPQGGRFDGENNNFGVVDVENQPYQDLVTQMEIMHSIAPDRIGQTGPSCDSWADTSTGVTCTAYHAQGDLSTEHLQHRPAGRRPGDELLQLRHHHRWQRRSTRSPWLREIPCRKASDSTRRPVSSPATQGLRNLQLHGDGNRFDAPHATDVHPDRVDLDRSEDRW